MERYLRTRKPDPMKGIFMKIKSVVLLLIFTLLIPPLSISQPQSSNKVYKVAILPFVIHSEENIDYLREGIYDILSSRITTEGRIVTIDRTAVERALYEERPMRLDEEAAKKIGMRVGADYIVLGSLTKIANYISLDARMISITEEKPPLTAFTQHKGLDDVMVKIGDFAQDIGMKILGRRPTVGRATGSGRSPFIQSKDMGLLDRSFSKSQTFNFEIKGIDIGDVDGDKKNELVVMDTNSLYIFKYNGEKLTLFQKQLELAPGNNFLTLDVADVNRNGLAEIIVTNMVDDNLRSFIVEFEEGRFKKITEKSGWFFRVLEHPKEGPVLMGQQMGSEGIIVGPIYKMVWKKTSFEKGQKMPFPSGTKLFGLALIEARAKGSLDTLVLDDFSRLRIVDSKGNYAWSSSDHLGGTNNYYETTKKKEEPYRPKDSPPWRVYVPGRILVRDLDGDGTDEVIINKNDSSTYGIFGRIRSFEKGEIDDLVWEENAFVTNWKTREIAGYISDFQVRDIDNDGENELVVAVVNPSGVLERKSTSNILFFKLP
jgi:TolB-like protein